MSYGFFARFYDQLTEAVNYPERAQYLHQLFLRYGAEPAVLLDLACGTGSLTYALGGLGYQMLGVDRSEDMLTMALAKEDAYTTPPQFFCQDMTQLELPHQVDGVVCMLDSLNHLEDSTQLTAVFHQLSLCTRPGGLLLFDVNSHYKMSQILADNVFIYETEDLYLGWQNSYDPKEERVEILLDFFEEQPDGSYLREQECFEEQYFSTETLTTALEQGGFRLLEIFGEDSFDPPKAEEQRLIYLAQRVK